MLSLFAKAFTTSSIDVNTLKVKAKYIYMADFDSQDIILEYNAREPMYPSSMTKIMTALIVFQALKDKKVTGETLVTVGREAYQTEGTTMFLNLNQTVSIMELLRGLICVSGNDAAKTLAVALEGSEDAFALKMTAIARKIGALDTSFTNASGLPHNNHRTTALDLYKITHYMIKMFPQEYALFNERSFSFNGITQPNKNLLLKKSHFDGVKTGFTSSGQYGIVSSMVDPTTKRRLILVLNGLSSDKERIEETERLMMWGLRQTKNIYFFKADQMITEIGVKFGDKRKVALVADVPVCVTLQADDQSKPTYEIILPNKYINGPLAKGSVVGHIVIKTALGDKTYQLKTLDAVGKSGMLRSMVDWFKF